MIIVEWGMERASGLIPVLYFTLQAAGQIRLWLSGPPGGGREGSSGPRVSGLVWSGLGKELKVIDWKQTNFAPACFCGRTVFGEGLSDY